MKIKIWTISILQTLLILTACATPSSSTPTPTVVRLALVEATATVTAANPTATGTPLPQPSATPATTTVDVATPISTRPLATTTVAPLRTTTPTVDSGIGSTPTVRAVTRSSNSGILVFATGSGGDLYRINTDGTGLQKLAGGVIDPVVSPDGTQVAFTRWDGAEFGVLYVMNIDGTGERAILNETRQAKSPTWSPDGQEIIVSFQHGGLRDPVPECREFDQDDGMRLPENIKIIKMHISNGILSICFIRDEDLQWGLRRVDIATGEFEDLPADLYSFSPTWDPQNPTRVIYDGQRGLMQLDLDTGKLQSFTDDVRDTAPFFSPDGQKLALSYKQHDHWEVYTYDLATGSRQRLTKPLLLADPQYSSAAPTWSPDGSQIAFVTDRNGQWEIWAMNVDGSNQRPFFSTAIQAQLGFDYQGMNERLLNWVDSPLTPTAMVTAPTAVIDQVGALQVETATAVNTSLSGMWDFNFGTMSLTQQDSWVEGSYRWYGGADTGRIEGIVVTDLNQFHGMWVSDRNPTSQQLLRWRLAADGSSFSGTTKDGMTGQQWCGVPPGQPLPDGCGFSGVWQLRFGSPPGVTGQATLVQTGQTVRGTYVDSRGHTGEIVDGVVTVQSTTEVKLTGTWRNDQGEQDSFEWRLDLTTGHTFQGRRAPGNSEWCGWREGTGQPEPCGWED
jgi:hypothetical protein